MYKRACKSRCRLNAKEREKNMKPPKGNINQSNTVRGHVMDLRDVRSGLAFVTFEAPRNLRASGFSLEICAMQESCQSFPVNLQPRRRLAEKKNNVPKYFSLNASPANHSRPREARKFVWCCVTKLGGQLL